MMSQRSKAGGYYFDSACTCSYWESFEELQESINYTFTVNQTGFVEGDLSTAPVYAKPKKNVPQ